MDILLDINVAVDICIGRKPWCEDADLAIIKCQSEGGRLWLYTGSVQTLEYVTRSELHRMAVAQGRKLSGKQLEKQARSLLREFAADKHWLAALADEGNVFDSPDPEDEQLIKALARFAPGSIKLLTRDDLLCQRYPTLTITPQQYLLTSTQPKPIDFIDLKTQQGDIRPELERRIHAVLHHGQYIMGPEVRELETRLEEYTGAKHCITVASGTEALLISLMALGVKPGDEIITTPFTFVATAEVIVLLGAIPVFVDIEPDTCNIDASKIEAAITPKTRAIMPVSLYGQPADMDEINAIAARHGNIPVIEDAAQSFGAEYKGRKSCNLSTIGCTSFFPSKPLGCYGDGGAIFTSDDALAQACREIRVHGQSKRYVHTRVGVGGRMDTIQCAIVLAKLERFDWEIKQRLRLGARYNELLEKLGVRRVVQRGDRTSVFGQYTVMLPEREMVQFKLQAAGIPTAVHYPVPLNRQPAYMAVAHGEPTPKADHAAACVMSLPMHPNLTDEMQIQVVNLLREALPCS
jgi:UDP-2-acetamido-2-deoxy-ribo-hexuluronate aminotransferase